MTVIFLTEYNTISYGVIFHKSGCIEVPNFKDISNDEDNILYIKPLKTFLGKSEVCDMTIFSGALDKSVFEGNTILLKLSEENSKHRYVYIVGDMICSFLTNDDIRQYISNMGNNLTPYSIAIGAKNTYFLTPHFELIKRDRSDYHKLLNTTKNSLDPFDYHISKCGKYFLQKLRTYKIHSNYD